ncbi:quinate permease [Aspergillus niger]|nr:quinate permease [Aspergillus niger]
MQGLKQHLTLFRKLTLKLLCAAICFGLSGAARGLDSGLIASTVAERSFVDQFHLEANYLSASQKANRLSNITSMVHIGSLPGAIVAFLCSERIGILWTFRQCCLMWIIGSVVFITSRDLGQVYAGRFIMGLGIGQFGVMAPIYLGEVAPREIRGMLVGLYGMSEYLGIMIGNYVAQLADLMQYFSIWGASIHIPNSSAKQWVIPQSVQIMWAGLLLIASMFCEESPRFLCRKDRPQAALQSLARLWNVSPLDPGIHVEVSNVKIQLKLEREVASRSGLIGVLKELFGTKSHLKRIAFVFVLQCLGEWSGPNSVTTYAPELFGLFGIQGQSQKLFTTAVFGAVKFVFALISAVFFIDYLGRRKTLYIGLVLQVIALTYDSIFLTIFSSLSGQSQDDPAVRHAAIGAIVMIYFIGIGWALGWNSIQYLITAESFPLGVRIAGVTLVTLWHYANRIGISKVGSLCILGADRLPDDID